jgi:pyridoxamine 5'-phosphate oxidase family protein
LGGVVFTDEEVEYLRSQAVMRLGTVGRHGQVDVSPVGFNFDGKAFYVGSSMMDKTHKGKNIEAGNQLVSLVVDDLLSTDPYEPRGIKVHGRADFVDGNNAPDVGSGSTRFIRIQPTRSWSFGILEPGFQDGKWTTHKLTWLTPD